jgi:hypothetical protein
MATADAQTDEQQALTVLMLSDSLLELACQFNPGYDFDEW